jgi:hypothetical protein
MIFSIRNVSRFGLPLFGLAWFATFVATVFWSIGVSARIAALVLLQITYFGGALALVLTLFRCPRCRAMTVTTGGGRFDMTLAPFWTPAACPRCSLDFRNRAFWSPDNPKLRSDWLLLKDKP